MMDSGQGVSQNLGSMRNASEKIGDVGGKLETIQSRLQEDIVHLNNIEQGIQSVIDGVARTQYYIEELSKNRMDSDVKTTGHFAVANSSITGLIIIYACSLAFKHNKAFPAEMIGNPFYVHGYITALEISASAHFRAIGLPNMYIQVSVFDATYFDKATNADYILNQIHADGRYAQALESIQRVKAYYCVTK